MEIQQHDHGDLTVLTVRGILALDTAHTLRATALAKLQDQTTYLVLDCHAIEFIDSSGLEALLWLQDRCAELLGQLRLACCPDHIRKVLEVTRLWSRFETHPDVDTAIASLETGTA